MEPAVKKKIRSWRGFGILLSILGFVTFFYVLMEYRVCADASATPESITLKALIARGVEGNPYIHLTDFVYQDNFVYENKPSGTTGKRVWVPLATSSDQERPVPESAAAFEALVKKRNAIDDIDVEALHRQGPFDGLIINKIESLGEKTRELLLEKYPNTNFDKCLIIEHGRHPTNKLTLIILLVCCPALFVVGAIMGIAMPMCIRKRAGIARIRTRGRGRAVNDTSPEAERVLIDVCRRMPIAQKWRQMGAMYQTAKVLHAAGVRFRNPTATDQEIRDSWMILTLGEHLWREVKEVQYGRRIDR